LKKFEFPIPEWTLRQTMTGNRFSVGGHVQVVQHAVFKTTATHVAALCFVIEYRHNALPDKTYW